MRDNLEVNPDLARKNLKILYPSAILVCILFSLGIQTLVPQSRDILNLTSIIIEITIGLLVTWTVFIYSKKWNVQNEKVTENIKVLSENLQKITEDVHKRVTEEANIRKEIIKDISFLLHRNLNRVIKELEHSLELYEFYLQNKDGKSEYWGVKMKEWYSRGQANLDLKIGLLDLMKIYGVSIARDYWNLLNDLQVTSNMYKDTGTETVVEFSEFVQASLNSALELKKIVEPLAAKV